MGEMSILGHKGDTKVIWDADNEVEVEAAREQFDTLTAKGFTAFKVGKKGEKLSTQIRQFDPDLEKMILIPKVAGG